MEYRVLGKTDLKVSVLSYGASPLGGVFGSIDEAEGIRTVHTALDLGVNYIDVSPYYGNIKAEIVLGKALRGIPRETYYLATKVGRFGPGEFDYSAERVIASVDESLKRMGVDYIDVIQCHDIEFTTREKILNETLPALRRVQEQGRVRFVGVTGLSLANFPAILDHAELDTILSFCHYTLFDTSLADLIPYLKEKKVGMVNASPLSMGLLTNQGPPAWHPASDKVKETCAKAATYCRSRGADIAKLALQFSLSNREIATTLVGTSKAEKMKSNVEWLEEPIDEGLLAEVQEILTPIRNETWQNS
jgi:aryl-alcohol dehydrogenase-like predicted oxidoreductase